MSVKVVGTIALKLLELDAVATACHLSAAHRQTGDRKNFILIGLRPRLNLWGREVAVLRMRWISRKAEESFSL